MVKKVRIVNEENGETIRIGSPRAGDSMAEKKFFGFFTADSLLKVGSVWIAVMIFLIGLDTRLKYLETERMTMAESIAKLVEFTKSSDNWNSSVFQVRFDNGKPVDNSYRSNKKGGEL